MSTFDLLSVRLFAEHLGRPDRMHGPDGSDRQTQEEPQQVAFGFVDGVPSAAVDSDQQHQGRGDAFGHRVLLLGSETFRGSFATALVQSDQGHAELDVRTLGDASGQVAYGRLLALANRRDVFLSKAAGLEVRDE